MENIKIGIDPSWGEADNALNRYNILWENVAKAYKSLGLRPLKTSDLPLIFGGDNFLKDILLEGADRATVAGIELTRSKLRELVDAPPYRREFLKAAETLLNFSHESRGIKIFLRDFEVIGGEIKFVNSESILRERYSMYASSPSQKSAYQTFEKMCDLLNNHKFRTPINLFANNDYIHCVEGVYRVNPHSIKRF